MRIELLDTITRSRWQHHGQTHRARRECTIAFILDEHGELISMGKVVRNHKDALNWRQAGARAIRKVIQDGLHNAVLTSVEATALWQQAREYGWAR